MKEALSAKCPKQEEFNMDLCKLFLTTGKPFFKVDQPAYKTVLKIWTGMHPPDESSLQKIILKLY